jgi:hypothetical protein
MGLVLVLQDDGAERGLYGLWRGYPPLCLVNQLQQTLIRSVLDAHVLPWFAEAAIE